MSAAERFPNGHLLWTPEELASRLGDENLVILDVRSTHQVVEGFIPGAAHLDIYGLSITKTVSPLFEEFINLMRSLLAMRGVGMERTVVLYEDDVTGMRAGRVFWLLEYFGHTDAHILDGGIKAWRDSGQETSTNMKAPKPHSLPISPREEIFITADALHGLLGSEDLLVLDTRTDDEYYGRNKRGGPRGGAIPGSVHLEWVHYLDQRGRVKPPAELLALFESHGVTRDKAIVPI